MMLPRKMKIGVIPTRRAVFSAEEAARQKNELLLELKRYHADIIDINDINREGLLFDEADIEKVVLKMKQKNADGIFIPHCNFGTEYLMAKVTRILQKPVLLWGPRDDSPLENGLRTRDTQCGLFATGKVLRRYNVPFSYIVNCGVKTDQFSRGFNDFIQVCSTVKAMSNLRILQIAPRPASFLTMMCNEGELLEKFGIELLPITLQDVATQTKRILDMKDSRFHANLEMLSETFDTRIVQEKDLETMAALYTMMKDNCEFNRCTAVSIQCWDALQKTLSIAPCAVNGLLSDDGIPVACETDIHGAISSLLLQEANLRESAVFMADFTIRHPQNDNAELLWHCGNFPPSLIKGSNKGPIGCHFNFENHDIGVGEFEIRGGDITLCRFDGDHGEYSLLMGEGKGTYGPNNVGTYVWLEVENWPKWERKLVMGPYVHHCAGVHAKVAHVLYEACKYIPGLKPDPVEPSEDEILNYLSGN